MKHREATRILFVCLGNICRAPTAEAVLRKLAPDLVVASAGVSGMHAGQGAYPPAVAAALARGYDLGGFRARQIKSSDFINFDLILALDDAVLTATESLRPAGVNTPVASLMSFAPNSGAREVPDPYYTRDFDQALALIEAGCRGLLETLRTQPQDEDATLPNCL